MKLLMTPPRPPPTPERGGEGDGVTPRGQVPGRRWSARELEAQGQSGEGEAEQERPRDRGSKGLLCHLWSRSVGRRPGAVSKATDWWLGSDDPQIPRK